VALRERQQRDIACLFDGPGHAPLMRGANAGQAPRNDLAALGNKALQQAHIAVWNGVDFLDAELADLLAAEKFPSAGAAACGPGWPCAWTSGT